MFLPKQHILSQSSCYKHASGAVDVRDSSPSLILHAKMLCIFGVLKIKDFHDITKEFKAGLSGLFWFCTKGSLINKFPSGCVRTKFNPPVEFCITKSLVSAVGSASCVKVPLIFAFPMLSMTNKLAPVESCVVMLQF